MHTYICRWWCESFDGVVQGIDTLKYENEQDFIKENNNVVESMGLHVQCVLNFADNLDEDGGTIIVPRFHKLIRQWCHVHADMKRPIPWLELKPDDPMIKYGQRVPMKEGSILVWNQTMFHGKSNYIDQSIHLI